MDRGGLKAFPMAALRAFACWCLLLGAAMSFNIESDYFVLHRGPSDSKFGFSLAQHRDTKGSWVLVGAPEASTFQPDVERGGAVYKCRPDIPDDCEPIPFDTTGNHWESGRQVDNKSMQWFGASVTSRSGVIVACAPRYVWFSVKKNRREPVGNCFISTGRESQAYQMYSPCMTTAWGYHRQGSCQAGFGTALTTGGNRLYVGAVGSFYWQGQVFYQDLLNQREALATGEGPQQDDMSYLGYSVATGEFSGDGEEDLAVGMPRGNNLTGQVVVFDHRLNILYNITGHQIGSYFGYSVTVLDANGDGLDDVAVGAPWYTDPAASTDFEEGSVSVYTQTQQRNFQLSGRLMGDRSRSHFGLSLASLGDLNRDGYGDLAVGAPYAGETARGGVYIFLGGPKGLAKTPSQVLLAEELTQVNIGTFGWSLAAGEDLDGNEYPDLAVGAYDSNKVAVFRTRPVVQVKSEISFNGRSGIIDLDQQGCSLQDGTNVPCVALQYCLTYSGHGVPKFLEVEVSLKLDRQAELSPRMFFLEKEKHSVSNSTIELRKSVKGCKSVYTYITSDPRDKLTPLEAEMHYRLPEGRPRVPREVLRAMLAPPATGEREATRTTIYIKNNCGEDNVCVPDLKTKVKTDFDEYVLGSRDNLVLMTGVSNEGEDSFQTKLHVRVPRGVTFSKFLVTSNTADDVTPICSALTREDDEEQVVCDVGNPLPSGKEIALQLVFQPNPEAIISARLTVLPFNVTATSTNEELHGTELDNHVMKELQVTVRSDIDIKGISWPDGAFDYNASRFGMGLLGEGERVTHDWQVGPEVTHVYDVTNQGPSDLPQAQIFLLWPTRTLGGDPLLYLLEEPDVSSEAVCHSVPDVNYLGLTVAEATYDHLITAPELAAQVGSSFLHVTEESAALHAKHRTRHGHRLRRSQRRRLEDELSCGPTNCTRVMCTVSPFRAKSNIIIRVRSRLWVDTIEKLGRSEVKITSRLVIAGMGMAEEDEAGPSWGDVEQLWAGTVTTLVRTGPEEHVRSLKWVVIVGSILAGLLLLALLSAILWALGFFKRKRPQDKSDSEPLNGNGFYSNGKS